MILAADIGNTHIQLGCIDDKGVIRGPVQMSTDRVETAFEYAAEIRQVLDLIGVCGKDLDGSIISSVVPNVTTSVASAFKILTGREPYILGQNIDSGLAVDMDGITADQIRRSCSDGCRRPRGVYAPGDHYRYRDGDHGHCR